MIDTLETYRTELAGDCQTLSPESFFDEAKTLEIEIGCGKGLFVTETARQNPSRFFLGMESAHIFARLAERRVRSACLKNVRILDWSAEILIPFF